MGNKGHSKGMRLYVYFFQWKRKEKQSIRNTVLCTPQNCIGS
jgi:hypothetical protein